MGLSSFVDIDIFVMKYLFLPILHFSRISQIKIYKMLRPQKGNSKVSLNDTLLNFGLSIDLNNELQVETNKQRNKCYLISYSFSLAVACR